VVKKFQPVQTNNQETKMNQATNHMNQLLSKLTELDSTKTKKQTVTESEHITTEKSLTDNMQPDVENVNGQGHDQPVSEANMEECGEMSSMSASGMPKTPASINMTAASGQELSSMLKDLMSLAGVHKVEPEHMPTVTAKLDTKTSPDMRAIIDTMNDEVAHEAFDNTPADATDVPEYVDDQHAYDPNTGDHRQRQAGLPRANPTRPMPVEESLDQFTLKLFQEYKNYISQ
jgi:hypothetical protein